MTFDKATTKDIEQLTELRVAYIQEDLGNVDEEDLEAMRRALPEYYSKHLNNDLYVYTARNDDREIVSCAFCLCVIKKQ